MLTKIHHIKFNHIWTQIGYGTPLEAHLKYQRVAFVKKEKMWWNSKSLFFKNHRNCLLRTSMKRSLFRIINSYSFNFNGRLCNRRTSFCLCRTQCPRGKNNLLRYHCILLLFLSSKLFFFKMCLVRSTMANMCPSMIHFDDLDFSECRSKEVISFFWRSVYVYL